MAGLAGWLLVKLAGQDTSLGRGLGARWVSRLALTGHAPARAPGVREARAGLARPPAWPGH